MRAGCSTVIRVVVALGCAAVLSGCAIERPGVSASSLNPSPWFNFQLAPRKKETANYQRNISRTTAERVTVQPAIRPAAKEIRWPELPSLSRKREAQLIPRTDEDVTPAEKLSVTAFSEESFDFN